MSSPIGLERKQLIAIEINWRVNKSLKCSDFYDKWSKKFGSDQMLPKDVINRFLQMLKDGQCQDAMTFEIEDETKNLSAPSGGDDRHQQSSNSGSMIVPHSASGSNSNVKQMSQSAVATSKQTKRKAPGGMVKSQKLSKSSKILRSSQEVVTIIKDDEEKKTVVDDNNNGNHDDEVLKPIPEEEQPEEGINMKEDFAVVASTAYPDPIDNAEPPAPKKARGRNPTRKPQQQSNKDKQDEPTVAVAMSRRVSQRKKKVN